MVHAGTAYRFDRGESAPPPPMDEASWVRWDDAKREARAHVGRFGAYPLYFGQGAQGMVLGSSVLDVARAMGRPSRLSPTAVARALCGLEEGEPSLVEGIAALLPHRIYRIGAGGVLEVSEHSAGGGNPPEEDVDVALERALHEALRRRAEGGTITLALSGGLDSSLLAVFAVECGYEVRGLSLRGDGEDADLVAARRLAQTLGLRLEEIAAGDAALVERLPSTVIRAESLIWNGRAAAKDLLVEAAGGLGAATMLSGVGADEAFMGHPHAAWASDGLAPLWFQRMVEDHELASTVLDPSLVPERPRHGEQTEGEALLQAREHQLRATLPFSTLVPECRPAAAWGVDVRLPFLDVDVITAARSLGPEALVREGLGKLVLRTLGSKRLPRSIWEGKKRPVLARVVAPAAREGWAELHRCWLGRISLERMPYVNASALAHHMKAFASTRDPVELARLDRLLMRLTSASILAMELRAACR